MDEKIIIKSKQAHVKLISLFILLIGVVAFAIVWSNETSYGFYADRIADGKETGDWNYVLTSMLPYFGSMTFLPFAVIALLFYAWVSKTSLTVTDKRVYGTAAFGKRVDLPLDKISAVGTSMFKGIAVTSASGAIKFLMIANHNEIHAAISGLLLERQEKNSAAAPVIKQEIPQSNAAELKQYKELLDSGIITQEEFDAKKKQLLGL